MMTKPIIVLAALKGVAEGQNLRAEERSLQNGCFDCGYSLQICCQEPGKSERCEDEDKCPSYSNTQTNKQKLSTDKTATDMLEEGKDMMVTNKPEGWGCVDCAFSLEICCQEPGKSDRCEYADKCPSYIAPTPTATIKAATVDCSSRTEGDCKSPLCSWIKPRAWETTKAYCDFKSGPVWQ